MRIVIFTSWGGVFPIPILKELLKTDSVEIVKIFSQGVHWKRIKKYNPSYYLNYKDNVSGLITREGFSNFEIIKSANDQIISEFIEKNDIDYIFTIGFGQILERQIINSPKFGIINFHPGILPENKGADPIAAVLMGSVNSAGYSMHLIDEGIDTGDVLYIKKISHSLTDTYDSLQLKIGIEISKEINQFIDLLESKTIKPLTQKDNEGDYFNKFKNNDGCFDFTMKGVEITRKVRTFSGFYKKAYFEYLGHNIYVENCEFIKSNSVYFETELVDQGLGYLIVACNDGIIILKGILIDECTSDISNQLLNKLFERTKKITNK